MQYPNNLYLGHFLRFLLAPTCCYQLVYPTTPNIRMGYLFKRVLELVATSAFMLYLVEQHMLQIAKDSLVHFKSWDYL